MTWASGQKLYGERYIIQNPIGEGGFGITYLAKDKKGNPVVIKTLSDKLLNNPQWAPYREKFLRDFRDEALRLALCRHHHIVQIDNCFNEGILPCIAMEYIEGETLSQRLINRGMFQESEALFYIRQVGSALSFIHDKGLLHRDIKPQNIMRRRTSIAPLGKEGWGDAVLIDFGISREFIENATLRHTPSATRGYAPPEQYRERAQRGEYTDVYALAATLYYLLTATVPTDVYSRTFNLPLLAPNQINPSISEETNQAILLGMELHPENRPQTVQAWLDFLPNRDCNSSTSPSPPTEIPQGEVGRTVMPEYQNIYPNSVPTSPDFYNQLQDLLAAQKWQEADKLTATLMLRIANREQEGFLWDESIDRISCENLRQLDNLWVQYSNGCFGFSVQKRIWESLGGQPGADYETFCRFVSQVGWGINENQLRLDNIRTQPASAPHGHFPSMFLAGGSWGAVGSGYVFSFLMQKLSNCNI